MERASNLLALALLFTVVGPADAQTAASSGAYESLSPGNQKIARALFEAQKTGGSTKPLTLDQIAAQKQGEGWGEVFKQMKSQGLVEDKNLGQVVSEYNHRRPGPAAHDSAAGHGGPGPSVNRGPGGSPGGGHGRGR